MRHHQPQRTHDGQLALLEPIYRYVFKSRRGHYLRNGLARRPAARGRRSTDMKERRQRRRRCDEKKVTRSGERQKQSVSRDAAKAMTSRSEVCNVRACVPVQKQARTRFVTVMFTALTVVLGWAVAAGPDGCGRATQAWTRDNKYHNYQPDPDRRENQDAHPGSSQYLTQPEHQ